MKKHLAILGLKVEDAVTGFRGIATTVSFDLYGCVQVIVNPGLDKEGKPGPQLWFDIARLTIQSETPVMKVPDFSDEVIGPSEKPEMGKP